MIASQTSRANAGGGDAVLYTCRSPDSEVENEDTVAIIPYGPQAAVLIVADGAGGLPAGKRASLSGLNCIVTSIAGVVDGTFYLSEQSDGSKVERLVAFVVAPGRSQDKIRADLQRVVR